MRKPRKLIDSPGLLAIAKEPITDEEIDMLERDLCPCIPCVDKAQLIAKVRQLQAELALIRTVQRPGV